MPKTAAFHMAVLEIMKHLLQTTTAPQTGPGSRRKAAALPTSLPAHFPLPSATKDGTGLMRLTLAAQVVLTPLPLPHTSLLPLPTMVEATTVGETAVDTTVVETMADTRSVNTAPVPFSFALKA